MNNTQTIFKGLTLNNLLNDTNSITEPELIEKYYGANFIFSPEEIQKSNIIIGEKPHLEANDKYDLEDAIKIYEYLKIDNELQASDPRLWSYLCHVDFLDYVRTRFPKTDKTNRTTIRERFFHSRENDARSLSRNAIARLWWNIHLTQKPLIDNPNALSALPHKEDKYYYARVLFSKNDIIQALTERSFGQNGNILLAILCIIDIMPEMQERENYRKLAKNVNQLLAFKHLNALPFEILIGEIRKIADDTLSRH